LTHTILFNYLLLDDFSPEVDELDLVWLPDDELLLTAAEEELLAGVLTDLPGEELLAGVLTDLPGDELLAGALTALSDPEPETAGLLFSEG